MSLKQQAVSGAKWTGISSTVIAVVQFSQIMVLARLLRPEDFGLMAMILVVLGIAQVYADMGMSAAIIYRQDTTRNQLSSLYWLNIASGIIVFVLVLSAVPIITSIFQESQLADLLPYAALVFLVQPIGQQFHVLLEKSLKFKILAAVDIITAAIGATVAIWLAVDGLGVWALVWGQLARTASRALWLLIIGWLNWRPHFHFQLSDIKGYIGFGLFHVGGVSANFFGQRLDQLLIGLLLGAELLGFYALAFNLVLQPMHRINPVLTRVAFPLFAKIQDDENLLRRGYWALQNLLSAVNFPISLGLFAISSVFVPVVLGEEWLLSVPLIQILAFVALLQSVGNPMGSLLLARGRADRGFYWNVAVLIIRIPVIGLGAVLGGLLGVALALLISQIFFTIFAYVFLIRPMLGRCLREFLSSVTPATVTAGIMGFAIVLFTSLVQIPSLLILILEILTGVFIYGVLNWFLFRERTRALWRLGMQRS